MSIHHSIVRYLAQSPLPLSELKNVTQVSLPTMRRAIQELSDARWVSIVGQAEANGGRPAMLFGLDDGYYLVIGVHLQLPGMRLITTDLSGVIVDELKAFEENVPTPGEAIDAIMGYVTQMREKFPAREILGAGIASPGYIDLATGDILSIGRVPSWELFPICRTLQAMLGVPVTIANDVDCMALAEFQNRGLEQENSQIYVGFDEGVKTSFFIEGKLYESSLRNTGLISGRLLHVDDAALQGRIDEWLTLTGVNRLFAEAVNRLTPAERLPYAPILAEGNPRRRFRLILEYDNGEYPLCRDLMDNVITVFSAAIAVVILQIQPDLTVIGGLFNSMPAERFADMERAVRNHLPSILQHRAIIRQGVVASRHSAALGATYHFLQKYVPII
ncbi:MAG: ROK family protein [Caldilineaceae bacterium]|nr:ROK family protein [Caldilineaceae bacterium]